MSLSVLVVEDEAVVAIDLEFALEELGHSVVGAGRLSEAMSAAQSSDFDLAILDVNLNGEPSYPVASVLEAKGVLSFAEEGDIFADAVDAEVVDEVQGSQGP